MKHYIDCSFLQCVKALVFYDANVNMLNINATNEVGDTPLHLAAKWGYGNMFLNE